MLFHDPFEFTARTQPEQLFVDDGSRALTYAQAAAEVGRIANGMLTLGLGPGRRFAWLSKNSADMLLMFLAASRIGAVPVPLNYRLAAAEWQYIIEDAQATVLFVHAEYVHAIEGIRSQLPGVSSFIAVDDTARPQWVDYRAWLAAQSDHCAEPVIDTRSVLYQMYTSGTTGRPKGVVITHGSYAANLSQVMCMIERRPARGDIGLVVTPLYHAAAVWICAFCLYGGMSIILLREFDPEIVVDSLERRRVNFTFLVPAMIQACLTQVGDVERRDWSNLHMLMYGASPISEATLSHAMQVFDCDFYQAYGMTETTAILTLLGAADHRRACQGEAGLLLSAGRALPGTHLRVTAPGDDSQSESVDGQVGEILARGPQMMAEYWRLPEETVRTMHDGWLHTGDAANMDTNGYIYIRDRMKDMVVSGGENIYPREIELVLLAHPHIADAAVIGVPNERYGEALLAFIVLQPETTLTVDEVVSFCRERLGGYKVPRQVQFVAALPRNPTGKVLKTVLRAPFWTGRSRAVG
ncbi:MAG TPA: long-chain-fatty-acid--CoA ligase [Steroidobacter sp.]|uniref:long-chain-fatty-acid--CoA ligase n=1 Tax=Steroidobacter sp. TaxID=1978227 RepID=UPI002EDA6FED